jgi:hypothetical protein
MAETVSLDPEKIVKTLHRFDVNYVLIGALAARLQGFPRMTADADITPAKEVDNLKNLAEALQTLKAKVFTTSVPEGLPFDCSAQNLKQSGIWNLMTNAGRLDIVFNPSGTQGYTDFIKNAAQFEAFGITLQAASLKDIIRSKKASDRPQDRQDIIILNEILNRQE